MLELLKKLQDCLLNKDHPEGVTALQEIEQQDSVSLIPPDQKFSTIEIWKMGGVQAVWSVRRQKWEVSVVPEVSFGSSYM